MAKIHEVNKQLFDFLELPSLTDVLNFVPGKTYHKYYTEEEERGLTAEIMKHFSSEELLPDLSIC